MVVGGGGDFGGDMEQQVLEFVGGKDGTETNIIINMELSIMQANFTESIFVSLHASLFWKAKGVDGGQKMLY